MIEVAVAVVVTGLLFLVVGLPFATAVREPEEGWIAYLTDSVGLGVVFLTLAITGWTWLGVPAIILAALVLAAFAVFAVRRRVGFPSRRGRVAPRRSLVIVWIAIVLVAIAFRLHDDTFLPWVGDMGAYVNWSNELVRTGSLTASWPPIFSVFLSVAGAVFGPAGTTQGIALTGFLFIAVVARLLTKLRINPWIVAGIGGALALNIHAIWYTSFPASESLNAPLFVIWLTLLVSALTTSRGLLPAVAAVTFLVSLNLNLLRGSGSFLLAPLVLLGIIALCAGSWRQWAPRIWVYLFASLAAAEVGVWYGVAHIPKYFVDTQLRMLIPGSLFAFAQKVGLVEPTALLLVVLLVLLAIAGAGIVLARRLATRQLLSRQFSAPRPDSGTKTTRVLALIAGVVLGLAVIAEGAVGANIWFILLRMGMWLVVFTIIGLVLVGRRRTVGPDTPLIFLATATVLMLIAFHTPRLGNDRPHAFFIYWDRYLVSEVLPALLILAGIGASLALAALSAAWERSDRRMSASPRTRRSLPAVVTVVAIALTAVPSIPILVLETQDSYMAGADTFVSKLMTYSKPSDTLLWGGTSMGTAPGFFFPNTWMAFAIPMHRSFGYQFLNVDQGADNFGPDDVVTESELTKALASHTRVLVYETQTGVGEPLGQRISSDALTITRVGEATSRISLLAEKPQLAHWTHARIHVIVWSVTAVG